jgi:hypothetical protein
MTSLRCRPGQSWTAVTVIVRGTWRRLESASRVSEAPGRGARPGGTHIQRTSRQIPVTPLTRVLHSRTYRRSVGGLKLGQDGCKGGPGTKAGHGPEASWPGGVGSRCTHTFVMMIQFRPRCCRAMPQKETPIRIWGICMILSSVEVRAAHGRRPSGCAEGSSMHGDHWDGRQAATGPGLLTKGKMCWAHCGRD